MIVYIVESSRYYAEIPEVNTEAVFAAREDAERFVKKATLYNAMLTDSLSFRVVEHELLESENFRPQNIGVSIWEAEDGSLARPYVFATEREVHPMRRKEELNCMNYAASWYGVFPYQESMSQNELIEMALAQCEEQRSMHNDKR
jgi:hypothetical protein